MHRIEQNKADAIVTAFGLVIVALVVFLAMAPLALLVFSTETVLKLDPAPKVIGFQTPLHIRAENSNKARIGIAYSGGELRRGSGQVRDEANLIAGRMPAFPLRVPPSPCIDRIEQF